MSVRARAGNEVTLQPAGPTALRVRGEGIVDMWLRDPGTGTDGEMVRAILAPGSEQALSIGDVDGVVVLSLPTGTATVLCGVR